ncbi:MAG TPA: 3-isopropylmalate dehydratase small subunit [Anaerolineales bacterium]|nr:3-isopropylmalate dehydratase small subunit [Anaerolineales bacterium]
MSKIWKYGDDINTDVIFPGKYTYSVRDPQEYPKYALEDLDPNFATQVQMGDVVVAGKNFGNGSSREQAVTCLKLAGVQAVVAVSFARIYYRNAINNGLLAITCPAAVAFAQAGDTCHIDLPNHTLYINETPFEFPPFSETAVQIMEAGGLVAFVKRKLAKEREAQTS